MWTKPQYDDSTVICGKVNTRQAQVRTEPPHDDTTVVHGRINKKQTQEQTEPQHDSKIRQGIRGTNTGVDGTAGLTTPQDMGWNKGKLDDGKLDDDNTGHGQKHRKVG